MRYYETIFVLDPALDSDSAENQIQKVEELLAAQKAEIVKIEKWGLKKLAYRIAGRQQGNYVFFLYKAQPATPRELEKYFKLNENILRYLTVVREEKDIRDTLAQAEPTVSGKAE